MNINTPGMGTFGSSWQAHGYSGSGNVASLIDSLRGRPAVVCGSASGVFAELSIALDILKEEPVIFAVNDVGMFLPKVHHFVSLHADRLVPWGKVREFYADLSVETKYHSIEMVGPVQYNWEGLNPLMALSGYFAMQIAHIMGASPIILAGCPGAVNRRFFEGMPRPDFTYGSGDESLDRGIREQVEAEMKRLPEFKEAVRSNSGWTRTFFGRF